SRSKRFYSAALAPLGYKTLMEFGEDAAGFGVERPDFWIGKGAKPTAATHVCFAATSRGQVDAFYKAAMAAGGRDHGGARRRAAAGRENGGPGLRPNYHPNYYGAFVLDADGNNVEAVCHQPG